jgi:glycosyltransferase A (GT-A) superfamily protein (DUF2064 family)
LHIAHIWLRSDKPRGVIGPADDGCFWLVGANASLSGRQWLAPQYGGADVLRAFLHAAAGEQDWHHLETRTDLDRIEDVGAVTEQLRNLAHRHAAQQRLLDWLIHHFHQDSNPS